MTVGELKALLATLDDSWLIIINDYEGAPGDQGTWHLREASGDFPTQPIGVTPTGLEPNDFDAGQPGPNNALLITYA